MKERIVVVGGGIIGLATAWRIGQRFPDAQVTVLEKESGVGRHQSGHNSGVLHAGLYYKPGSRKAMLAVRGIRQMIAFCREHSIAHEICGKVVVATSEAEIPRLKNLLDRGTENGLRGLRWLSRDELHEIEPHAAGLAAVHVPEEGIADYPAVCRALVEEIRAHGGEVLTNAEVRAIHRTDAHSNDNGWLIETTRGEHRASRLVTCAGLYSDRLAAMSGAVTKAVSGAGTRLGTGAAAGLRRDIRIVPFRGEYYAIRPERQHLVRNLIYPVPDPSFPFLGVHFTRLIHGGVEAGPNAVLAYSREGYTKTDIRLRDLADALTFSGLRRFLARHPSMCWMEVRRSFSKDLFCASLQKLVPEIQPEDLIPGGAGVRAQAMTADGALLDDFLFIEGPGELHVINAPSPGATASLAIGEEIAETLARSS